MDDKELQPTTLWQTFVRAFLFYKYSWIATIKLMNGRWFVFRDRPFWFVAQMATMPKTGDQFTDQMIDAATDELESRLSALTRAAAEIGRGM